MHQVHGADVTVVDGAPAGDAGRGAGRRRPGHRPARRGRCWSGSPTACRCCWPTRTPAWSARVHAGRPGLVAGRRPGARWRRCARSAPTGASRAWVGPHVCGACYEVPAQLRADVAAVVPEALAETSWGTPSLDVGAGVRAQLAARRRRGRRRRRAARVEDADLFSYRRDGRGLRPAGRPGLDAAVSDAAGDRARRQPRRRYARRIARRLRARRPRPPTRSRCRGHQVLPRLRRPPARRARRAPTSARTGTRRPRPRRAECADLDLTLALHRRPAEQQGRRGRRATPTSWSRSTGPSCVARRSTAGRPRARPRRSTSCSRSASTRPGRAAGRAGADPADVPALADAVEAAGVLRLRGLMAVAPLGEDPAAAFARLAADRRATCAAVDPDADLALGRA